MTKIWRRRVIIIGANIVAAVWGGATAAFAHTGHSPMVTESSLGLGFIHPFSGLDHILMLLAVGVLASQYGGAHRWKMPAWFIAVLAAAGIAGVGQAFYTTTEIIVALSVAAAGIILFVRHSVHSAPIYGALALFAGIHGFVHGVEKPIAAATETYVLGFSIAAAMLITGGLMASQLKVSRTPLRYALSALMMGAGLFLTLS